MSQVLLRSLQRQTRPTFAAAGSLFDAVHPTKLLYYSSKPNLQLHQHHQHDRCFNSSKRSEFLADKPTTSVQTPSVSTGKPAAHPTKVPASANETPAAAAKIPTTPHAAQASETPANDCQTPSLASRAANLTSSAASAASSAASAASTAAAHYSPKQLRKSMRSYVFGRYISYIKNYDAVLERKFPAAMKVYRVFAVGIRDFYGDMKRFLKITRIVNKSSRGFRALTRREIELYYQMPKDMLRVAPVLALSALPFANYVIFPVAYMFPKQFLSPHFWSIQQRFQFTVEMLRDRLQHQLPVLRFLQQRLDVLRPVDAVAFQRMRSVLGRLGAGQHPTVDEVRALTEIMSTAPYNLESLPRNVLSHLCGLHGIHRGIRKRSRLAYHTYIVHHMDLAIRREGDVHNMPADALLRACNIRGLNTTNMSNEEMVEWLRLWVDLSVPVDGRSISLFLFLPIFITYNHPNNWKLLYRPH